MTGPGLAVNAASTILIFCLYAGGFSVLKGAIAVVSPFAWDAALAELDRALHLGGCRTSGSGRCSGRCRWRC